MCSYIGIIDSGAGGIGVLKECKKILPNENFVYLADTLNAPYGNKNKQQIYVLVKKCIYYLIENYNIKALVLACNTATVCCINKLRDEFGIKIVGSEPPLKVVLKYNSFVKIILLSTVATKKYSKLVNFYKKNKRVLLLPQKKWAKLIDDNFFNLNKIHSKFKIKKIKKTNYIVLGCTHYTFIKNILENKYKNKYFIDCNHFVAKRLKYVLERYDLICKNRFPQLKIISTKTTLKDEYLFKIYNF